jgi:hypothetical protein
MQKSSLSVRMYNALRAIAIDDNVVPLSGFLASS